MKILIIPDVHGSHKWEIAQKKIDEVDFVAVKRVLAYQLQAEMKAKKITKTKMAELMKTSRSVIDRLLSPTNTSLTLQTLQSATSVLGKKLSIEIR